MMQPNKRKHKVYFRVLLYGNVLLLLAVMAEGSKFGSTVTQSGGSFPPVSERISGRQKVEMWEDISI